MALEIIGPGFGRTGTNSLQLALEQLGFGPCHHMHEVGAHPEQLPAWDAVSRGQPADWDAMFTGYRSQVDWPGAAVWRQLVDHYPKAKVVLTVRDPDAWYDSVEKTIIPFMASHRDNPDLHGRAIADMTQRHINQRVFGGRITDRLHAIAAFHANTRRVQETVAPERLLVFDVKDGWEPLCTFLGVAVPETPFPRVNSAVQFNDPEWKGR